jgi:two-component system chemotaxis sensor kinase CheA
MGQIGTDDMQAQLMAIFPAEAQEHVQAMNRHLLALEDGSASEAVEQSIAELFRAAHTLKGAARVVGLKDVEAHCHELESLFLQVKEGGMAPTPDTLEAAFHMLDAIEASLRSSASTEQRAAVAVEPHPADDSDAPPEAVAADRRSRSEESVRIATDKLDALIAGVGELLVSNIGAEQRVADVRAIEEDLDDWASALSRLSRHSRRRQAHESAVGLLEETAARLHAVGGELAELRRLLEADARRTAQITTNLQDDVRQTRMLPVARVFEAFPRMVRDLARESGKDVALSISGGDTEVDRSVLEQIKDPIMHLLRNSVDHGIEAPEVRAQAGKPASTISLSAQHRGDMLLISVTDDGAGIDVDAVRAGAVTRGLITSAAAAELSDRQAMALIFRSGLSTSPIVTDLSGRGVGLDVVREAVEFLHGSVDVESQLGAGTTFSLTLPLSVSTLHCLLIEAGGQTFALPVSAVERVMRAGPEDIGRAEGRGCVALNGRPVVLARLADVLGLDAPVGALDRGSKRPLIVLGGREQHAAFLVDRLMRTHEVVVKSLPDPLLRVRHLAGATILGTGQVVMLLNATDLLAFVERDDAPTQAAAESPQALAPTILVVEDSITTRTLEKNILEAAGYRVRVAGDGAEGLRVIDSDGCDLVVTDVEMPVMDGLQLTSTIRADARHRDLPIVLVTSRDAREDRERGIQAGADAYIVKGAFDQDRLLDTIRRLI